MSGFARAGGRRAVFPGAGDLQYGETAVCCAEAERENPRKAGKDLIDMNNKNARNAPTNEPHTIRINFFIITVYLLVVCSNSLIIKPLAAH